MDTRKKIIFFYFPQSIPLGKLLREKGVLVSSNFNYFWAKFLNVRKVHIRGSFNASKQRNNVVILEGLLRRKNNCGPMV